MHRYIKIAASVAIAFIVLLSVFVLTVNNIVNLDSVRIGIIDRLENETGGNIEIGKVGVSFSPALHLVAEDISFDIKNDNYAFRGSSEKISVYPKLLKLIGGHIKIGKVVVHSPSMSLKLKDFTYPLVLDKKDGSSTIDILEKKLKKLSDISSGFEDLFVGITKGRLNLYTDNATSESFNNISSTFKSHEREIKFNISCDSSVSKLLILNADFDPTQMSGHGIVRLVGFEPHRLTKYLYSDSEFKIKESDMDMVINLDTFTFADKQDRRIVGELSGNLKTIKLINKNKNLHLEHGGFKGSFDLDNNQQTLSISEFNLEKPKLKLNGELSFRQSPKLVSFVVGGEDLDVDPIRSSGLSFLDDSRLVNKIFDVIRGGRVESIKIFSRAVSLGKLFRGGNYKITGRMKRGEIYVRKIDRTFSDVSGDAEISDGILMGINGKGKQLGSYASNVNLTLGLTKQKDVFQLDALVKADIRDIQDYLMQFSKNKKLNDKISLIKDAKGIASGSLVIGDKKSSMHFKVEATSMNLTAYYERIPYPLIIKDGNFLYDRSRIEIKDLAGTISQSDFSALSLSYDWSDDYYLEISSADAVVSANEFYEWLISIKGIKPYLERYRVEKGEITISELKFKGSPLNKSNWEFGIRGRGKIANNITTNLEFELQREDRELNIKSLKINDEYTDVVLGLKYRDKLKEFTYGGKFNSVTLDNIYQNNQYLNGVIEGDIGMRLLDEVYYADGVLQAMYSRCGMSVNGVFNASSENVSTVLSLKNQDTELDKTIQCLTNKESPVSGTYQFNVDIESEGVGHSIKELLQGTYNFSSKNGALSRKESIIFKIFSLLNISTLFRGKIGTLSDEYITYNELSSSGIVKDGRFIIENAQMYGPSTGLLASGYIDPFDKYFDIRIKATPLESIDWFMRIIPLLKEIQTKKFIFIPIHAEGWFDNHKVSIID